LRREKESHISLKRWFGKELGMTGEGRALGWPCERNPKLNPGVHANWPAGVERKMLQGQIGFLWGEFFLPPSWEEKTGWKRKHSKFVGKKNPPLPR